MATALMSRPNTVSTSPAVVTAMAASTNQTVSSWVAR